MELEFLAGESLYLPAQGGPTQRGGRFLVENNLFVGLVANIHLEQLTIYYC